VNATVAIDQTRYRVLVTGQCGVTTSGAALLTVQRLPAISAHPQDATICVNNTTTFSVTASGQGISYQWQLSTDGVNFNNIPGANLSNIAVNNVTTAQSGNRYRVVVTGTCAPPATSNAAVLTVRTPAVVTTNPNPVVICATGNVTFIVAGTSTPALIYQWQVSTDGVNYSNITDVAPYSGTTTATLTMTNVTTTLNNNRYRAVLSNSICTTPVPSTGALLTVNARPTVTLAPAGPIEIEPGELATLTATINPSPVGFNVTWYQNTTPIPGVTGTSYIVDSVAVGDYKVGIVNTTTGCNNESNVVQVRAKASERLFVYPSPNTGRFTVSYLNTNLGGPVRQTFRVYDAHGALVYSRDVMIQGPYTLTTVDLSHAATGIYLIVVGDFQGKKLAKEKVFITH
jgi:hypothetical protein